MTMTYDDNGNLTRELSTIAGEDMVDDSHTYDNENRMLKNYNAATNERYTYTFDGVGRRRSRFDAGGNLTTFVNDRDDYLMEKS